MCFRTHQATEHQRLLLMGNTKPQPPAPMGELQVEALLPDIKVISDRIGFKIQRIKYFTISTPNHLRQDRQNIYCSEMCR